MNISDLKNFDVKNLDLGGIQSVLQTRQDIAANIALVLATLFFIFQIVTGKQNEAQTLKSQVTNLEKKIEVIKTHKQALQELTNYIQALPAGTAGSAIVDKLTDFAEKRGVRIVFVSPTQTVSKKLYEHTSVNLSVTAKTYKDLWLFLYDIETAPNNLRIDKWSASMDSNRRLVLTGQAGTQPIVENLNAQLEIGSINFKK